MTSTKDKIKSKQEIAKKVKQSIGRLDVPPTKKISPVTVYKRQSKYREDFLHEYSDDY